MRAVDYVMKLTAEPSTNAKQDIIREAYESGCVEFFKAFQLAYDKRRVFGVKKVPTFPGLKPGIDCSLPSTFDWNEFEQLVRKLEMRELTGHNARDAILEAAESSNIPDWNHLYRPILIKDMRCGTSDTLVNKVLKKIGGDALDLLVPVWKVQLAQDSKKHQKKMKGKKAIDPKLDGMRLTAVLDKDLGTARLFSRSGKENTNFNEIIATLEKLIEFFPVSMVLDGEVVSANFQTLMTKANRKSEVDTSDAHFALFDVLTLTEFEAGISNVALMQRHTLLNSIQNGVLTGMATNVYVIPKKLVDLDTDQGIIDMQLFYEETVVAGYEGIMVKDRDAPYECKRTSTWLKWKPYFSADLRIIAAIEGKEGKKREGKLGAFTCEGTEDGKHIRVNVGSGYNDEQLDDFWQNRESLIGELVEIEFDSITKSEDGAYWSLRFPRFKCFRSIDRGEKM